VIRPVTTYGSETWTLTKSDENPLRIFKGKYRGRYTGQYKRGIPRELDIMKN
jgi:hypothetical protein